MQMPIFLETRQNPKSGAREHDARHVIRGRSIEALSSTCKANCTLLTHTSGCSVEIAPVSTVFARSNVRITALPIELNLACKKTLASS